jgi:hypothetical protein
VVPSMAEEGLGLADQEHACRAWARQHGHQVLTVFRDEGVSGPRSSSTGLAWPRPWLR